MQAMYSKLFQSLIERKPEEIERKFIFLVNDTKKSEKLTILGFNAFSVNENDYPLEMLLQDIQEQGSALSFSGNCAEEYTIVPFVENRKSEDSILKACEGTEFKTIQSKNLWKFLQINGKVPAYLFNDGYEQDLKKKIVDFICDQTGNGLAVSQTGEIEEAEQKPYFLDIYENGRIKQSLTNTLRVLKCDPWCEGMFRYDSFVDRIRVTRSYWNRADPYLTDNDLDQIELFLESVGLTSVEGKIVKAVRCVAHENEFHPVRKMLESLPEWDGQDRIAEFFPYFLGADQNEATTEMTKIMLMGAISRIFEPGCKFDYCLILVDQKQGSGKSSLCRLLAINDSWFSDGVKDFGDPRIFEKLRGHWICELGEMTATASKKDIEEIKSGISRQYDSYREPYARCSRDLGRQNIFIGTSNKLENLPMDSTGNRRFLPLRCNWKNRKKHPLEDEGFTRRYIEQLWSQSMAIYESGDFKLCPSMELEKQLEEIREVFTPVDTDCGLIEAWLDSNRHLKHICIPMVWNEALGNEGKPIKAMDSRRIASLLDTSISKLGWQRYKGSKDSKKRFPTYGTQKAWEKMYPEDVPQGTENRVQGFQKLSSEEQIDLPFS